MDDEPLTDDFAVDDTFARILTATTESLVCVLDREGRIRFFNAACSRLTGYTRDEALGRDARDLVIPPEEADSFGEMLEFVWKTGVSSPRVGHWTTKGGGRLLVSWSNKPMPGPDGELRYLVTTGIDLTGRAALGGDEPALAGDPEAKLLEVGRIVQEQHALRRVATLVAAEASPERVFQAVSEECARVFEVVAAAVVRYDGDDTATIVARHDRDGINQFAVGDSLPANETTALGRVLRTGAPARIDDWSAVPGSGPRIAPRIRSSASAPIAVGGVLWGAVAIGSEDLLPPASEARLGAFCELVSLAVASAQARADLRASRARVIKAGDEQRQRLERNLHDGAQQRLVSLALVLRLARDKVRADPDSAERLLAEATQELNASLEELREIARGLHPGVLTTHGLRRALEALATRLPVEVDLDVAGDRFPAHVEATAYYIAAEALTNVARHAGASRASVSVRRDGDDLRVDIADDGRGGADPAAGTGIVGLRDRAEAAGGTLLLLSPRGGGTVVRAVVPLGDG
jgi:PAS domain S-box-containing protein